MPPTAATACSWPPASRTTSSSWIACCRATSTAWRSSRRCASPASARPILILSALSDVDERIRGLRAGGDDYLTKPFAFGELLARLDALTRRAQGEGAQTKLEVGDLRVDLLTRKVTRGDRDIVLQPREFKLLEYLMRHADQVVTRTMLLENVWDYHFDPQTNVVDVHISKLRQKIDADFERPLLRTVRNAGYTMTSHD